MSKILFIGGSGVISSACSQLVVDSGDELYVLSRGVSNNVRPLPEGAVILRGDIHQEAEISTMLESYSFDVVVDWVAFDVADVERDIRLFSKKTSQYVFISSASAYQKPVRNLPITEETPLENPYWEYSRKKIACEERLFEAYQQQGFPVTVVRPSHTYDRTMLPFQGRYTVVDRMLKGKPVVVHGDGTSLWVLTHHRDFAKGFVPMLGREQAVGEAYQITSDMLLSWNEIFEIVAEAFGAKLNPVYIPSNIIASYDPVWGAGLLGDKMHSVIFDNSKIKALVPGYEAVISFREGVQEIAKWYRENLKEQNSDEIYSGILDRMIADYRK